MKGQRAYSSAVPSETESPARTSTEAKGVGRSGWHGTDSDPWYFGIPRSSAKEQEKQVAQ
jgi:hypothetical protein